MKHLWQPIPSNSKGSLVADLHELLLVLGFAIREEEIREQFYGESTREGIRQFQQQFSGELMVTGELDEITMRKINSLTGDGLRVKGHCYTGEEQPLEMSLVKAFDRDLRSEELLGEATTDAGGYYEIYYTKDQYARAEIDAADIVVKLFNADGLLLAKSPIYFNAGPDVTIDLKIGGGALRGPNEYDQLKDKISSLLQGLSLADLREDKDYQDISFITGETGGDKLQITALVVANQLAAGPGAGAAIQGIPPEIFYCLFRQQLPAQITSSLNSFLQTADGTFPPDQVLTRIYQDSIALDAPLVRSTIVEGIQKNIIASRFSNLLDAFLEKWKSLQTDAALQSPYVVGKTPLRDLLNVSISSPDVQKKFVQLYQANTQPMKLFWEALVKEPGFSADIARDLKQTLQFGYLSSGHLPLVTKLRQMQQTGSLSSARELARMDQNEWVSFLGQPVDGKPIGVPSFIDGATDQEKTKVYAYLLATRLENRYPTTAFSGRLAKDETAPKLLTAKADLLHFIDNNPGFRLGVTNVDQYIAANPDALKNTGQPDALKEQLKMTHRVYKMAPAYASAKVLLSNNIHSGQQVYQMGRANFVNQYGTTEALGKVTAGRIYAKAEQVYAYALTLFTGYNAAFNTQTPAALPNLQPDEKTAAQIQGIPDLESLFGSQDFCECKQCRSVNSPSAYFVDILQFLTQRTWTNGKSPKDVLFERRSDLGTIELSCKNTNTPLPYIDLVCEILEDTVSPPMAPLSRQTTNTADELAANPQYINTAAYDKLGKEVFPFGLPFDLWIENVRTYLGNMGTDWYTLRKMVNTIKTPSALENYQEQDEYIKISDIERQILTGSLPAQQSWDYWGLQQNGNNIPDPLDPAKTVSGDWITVLSYVPVFLHRTGLIYRELLVLLELRFINPGGALKIINAQQKSGLAECDTSQFTIKTLDQNALDRIHRFLRLYRKTGCSLWELDKMIMNPAIGNGQITDDSLSHISIIFQLQNKYDLGYESIQAFWADIDVTNYIDFTDNDEPTVFSLYAQLFRNKTVLEIKDIEKFFKEDPATLSGNLSDALVPIAGACTLSLSDLNLILVYLAIDLSTAQLDLRTLSAVYRYAQLTSALGVPVEQLITLFQLIAPLAPFSSPENTLLFIDKTEKIQNSAFSIDQLNYLLAHQWKTSSGVAPDPANIALFLNELRAGLQKIYADTTLSDHPDAQELTTRLAMLKWDNNLVVQAGNLLNDKIIYTASTPSLPAAPGFPAGIPIAYDPVSQLLSFTGVMRDADKVTLLGLFLAHADYQAAIPQFYDAPRNFLQSQLKFFVTPSYSAPLDQLAPDINFTTLPKGLNAKISYDASVKLIGFKGAMTTDEQTALKALAQLATAADLAYRSAVDTLFNAPGIVAPDPQNLFVVTNADPSKDDIKILFDPVQTPTIEDRFRYLLQKLNTYLRNSGAQNLVKQKFSSALQLNSAIAGQLIIDFQASPLQPDYRIIQDYNQDNFVLSNISITADSFPRPFTSYVQLYKLSILVNGLKIGADEWPWWTGHAADFSSLVFNLIPLAPGTIVPFDSLAVLLDAYSFRNSFPKASISFARLLQGLLDATLSADALRALLAGFTYWDADDLKQLEISLPLVTPGDYRNFPLLLRLARCLKLLKRLGIPASRALAWVVPALTSDLADQVKQAAKAKYDNQQWLQSAKKLQDGIREKKRDALIAYLIYHPELKGQKWKDANDLYAYYLIDIQMCACQPSSRIVQANNTVQLFVQRCLMNLETEVVADPVADPDWLQWKWMKYYRLWEANRKVFLYAENWIEPELRDNKSSFFKDLESQLMQNELTASTAEDAFLNYLEKLDDVARLEVAAVYHEQEYETNLLHVFGRTHGQPPLYYYRRKDLNTNVWTAWEKIDLDIKSEHLVPVLWNRRLFLFWAVFTEKPNKVQPLLPAQANSNPPPQAEKHWEVQLARSEYKNKKWLAKKVSSEKMVISNSTTYPLSVFTLKSFILANGNLEIALYSEVQSTMVPHTINFAPIPFISFLPEFSQVSPYLFAKFSLTGVSNFTQLYSVEVNSSSVEFYRISDEAGNMLALETSSPTISMPASEIYQYMDLVNMTSSSHSSADNSRQHVYNANFLAGNRSGLVSETALTQADPFSIVTSSQLLQFDSSIPFFFQDISKSYFITPVKYYLNGNYWVTTPPSNPYNSVAKTDYLFQTFYHPYAELFIKELNRWGIGGLLNRKIQVDPNSIYMPPAFDFNGYYLPTSYVDRPYPVEDVDFSQDGSYSLYNWELFFHAPLLIAGKLSKNQRFEEAMQWFHYIFNPTNTTAQYGTPASYWITKPFFQTTQAEYLQQRIDQVMAAISKRDPQAEDQVKQWRNNPFDPHLIARLRPVAYQKTVVMKYIDNLIAWGDNEFRKDTMESVNIATQLYVLAAEILGPRPQNIPAQKASDTKTYNEIAADLDKFSNVIIDIENIAPSGSAHYGASDNVQKMPTLQTMYFCIPPNDKLAGYWDLVEDRLYKIRHCLNIEGVFAPLALFAPPIDPGMLVRASAAGVDLNSVLADMDAPLPFYRFSVMSQKATELCAEVKALGSALLSALEKRDAESITLLRSSQEIKLLDKVRDVKSRQIDEATQTLEGLNASRQVIQARKNYYDQLILGGLNGFEQASLDLAIASTVIDASIAVGYTLAGGLKLIPDFMLGVTGIGGTPHAVVQTGGKSFGDSAEDLVKTLSSISHALDKVSSLTSTMGGHQRRADDWKYQSGLAQKELDQNSFQVAAGQIRLDITNKELDNHDLQRENAQQVDDLMHDKFSNQDLYDWMVGQVTDIYFQSYQLAYDMAKKAERSFRFELGLSDSAFIQFGYWDSLKKGLQSGERLFHDIKRMETAYLEQNRREYELTKHISLMQLDPVALLKLKENGECFADLPEMIFDMDYPGQYMRRIKSASITLPCVAGPYTSINCKLTLVKNSIRANAQLLSGKYQRDSTRDDPRFRDNTGSIQSIATSSAQNDSGLFEMNFRDERYLPFEGVGAISSWHIELNNEFPSFDRSSISDLIIHLKYTAREGGDELKANSAAYLNAHLKDMSLSENKTGLFRVFSGKQDFPGNWYKFLRPENSADDQQLLFELSNDRFSFFTQGKTISADRIELIVACKQPNTDTYSALLSPPLGAGDLITLTQDGLFGSLHHGLRSLAPAPIATWTLKLQKQGAADFKSIGPDELEDVLLLVHYKI